MSDDQERYDMGGPQHLELWSIDEVANYLGCSESRARALLASRAIPRISGYPADQVRQIQRRQGHRTDLNPPPSLGTIQEAVLRQLGGERLLPLQNPLVDAGLKHLHDRGYAEPTARDSWRLTPAGREALTQLHTQDAHNRDEHAAELTQEELDRILQTADRIHGRINRFIVYYKPDTDAALEALASLSVALPPVDSYPEWLEEFARDHAAKLTSIFDAHREAEPGHPLRSPISIVIFERLAHTPLMFQHVATRSPAITEQELASFQSAWRTP
ncbi:hypothetical protein [Mycobacteroides abscessus]|uniref:hypothetical protein n=1 Tax=Mycobacteroides abscessus TaxID=36809 RepID=UPI0015FF08CE|nr:hypothetical protein [Mycobacteroides abscessus]